jgi:hypothetical protein
MPSDLFDVLRGRRIRQSLWCLLLVLCPMTALAQASTGARGDVASRTCGVERWPVKILADRDRDSVRFTPIESSILELREIPIPTVPYPQSSRIGPHEHSVYRLRAVIRQVITEEDGDWHLVLADPDDPSLTMVAEVPDSACAFGTRWAATYTEVRRTLRAIPRGAIVELDGVGFFDFLHGQRGMAPNGVELHPVLAIHEIAPPEPSAPPRLATPSLRRGHDQDTDSTP